METIMKALAWTLVHSLWQGLLAALLAAIIISVTGKTKARLRYNLLGAVLLFFVVAVSLTFLLQFQENEPASSRALTVNSFEGTESLPVSTGFTVDLSSWFNSNTSLFLLIWSLFFLVNCLKLVTGLFAVNRLRHYKTLPVTEEWKIKLEELKLSMGIRQSIELLQSALVKVPVALGFLKPVILLPVGLLANIPAEHVEAILLHELGHIRRKDYLVNFVQHFVEAVFFFNPGLVWISSLLRQEREACCDDIVLAKTGQKRTYLNALVSFQEYSLAYNSYAIGITGRKQHLLNRVKRILTNENRQLGLFEKLALFSGLILFSAFTFMTRETKPIEKPGGEQVEISTRVREASSPKEKLIVRYGTVAAGKEKKKTGRSAPLLTDTIPVRKTKVAPLVSDLKQKTLPTKKDWKVAEGKDWKVTEGKDWKASEGKDWKATEEKDLQKKEHDPKDVLDQIIEIKKQIGVKKEKIGIKKEQLKAVEGKNNEAEKELKKELERERGELEGDRGILEKKRALLQNLKQEDDKRKQKERNEKPRVSIGKNRVETIADNHSQLFSKRKMDITLNKTQTREFKIENLKLDKQSFQYKMNGPVKIITPKLPPEKEKLQSPTPPKMKATPASKVKI